MNHKSKYIIWLFFLWMFIAAFPVCAEDQVPMTCESMLLDKINDARENPLATAESFGLDANELLEELPELQHILINGLPPVNFNDSIYQAARSHVADMVTHRYYDYTSIDGKSVKDRIAAFGYDVSVSGELLGMLGFFNYIAPDLAVDRIFENMFRNELDAANPQNRRILNPAFKDAAAAMDAGVFQIGRSQINVYMAACDFAAKPMWILENEYLALINQARANPLEMARILGMDPDKIIADNPEIRDLLENGVAPVVFNRHLYISATAHGQDMLNNDYFSPVSLDGRTVADRISETGCQVSGAGEEVGSMTGSDWYALKDMAYQIFKIKFSDELVQGSDLGSLTILNPEFTDAAVSLQVRYTDQADGETVNQTKYLLMVVDFAKPMAESFASPLIWGTVYADLDQSGLYSPGEGLAGKQVRIHGESESLLIFTDFVGRFVVPVSMGQYRVQALEEGGGVSAVIDLSPGSRSAVWLSCQ